MARLIYDQTKSHSNIQNEVGGNADYRQTVEEVNTAIHQHDIVIVGMKQNPFPKAARKLLDKQGVNYHYMEYGNYLTEWKRRGALKMWCGWPTFPMIFIKGQLIGGKDDLQKLVENGEFNQLIKK